MQPTAVIYQPAKTSMQSGRRRTKKWVFEYAPDVKNAPDPLMGWSSGGTVQQIRLEFDSKEEAIRYAQSKGITAQVIEPKQRAVTPKSYAANFAFNRRSSF